MWREISFVLKIFLSFLREETLSNAFTVSVCCESEDRELVSVCPRFFCMKNIMIFDEMFDFFDYYY